MGLGDNLLASGIAKGARARGKRIAFGDGRKIIWDHHSEEIFGKRGTPTENPNVARPGDEDGDNLEWVPFYRGNRIYNKQSADLTRWIWNYEFKPTPGEVYFSDAEDKLARSSGKGFVVVEPNTPRHKVVSPNKQWPILHYTKVSRLLRKEGYDVVQLGLTGSGFVLPHARQIMTKTFRHALAVLKNASLYIGPEGGLHHGAAAVGVPSVVLFGGFIPPAVTGYPSHTNLTGDAVACGSLFSCNHCREAMGNITVPQVMDAAKVYLEP